MWDLKRAPISLSNTQEPELGARNSTQVSATSSRDKPLKASWQSMHQSGNEEPEVKPEPRYPKWVLVPPEVS